MLKIFRYSLIFLLFFTLSLKAEIIYLTWQGDPSTTMTVQWITSVNSSKQNAIRYRLSTEEEWKQLESKTYQLPNRTPFVLNRIVLQGLQPDSSYDFVIDKNDRIYKFRTLSTELKKPLSFAVGGDVYHDGIDFVRTMNQNVARANPAFAVVGGDLAYSVKGGMSFLDKMRFKESFDRWKDWLEVWSETMITSDGFMIPILPAIGNHEAAMWDARFFYALFPIFGYRTLDFGDYMSLIFLDSDHTNPIKGRQTQWLENALKQRKNVPYKCAIYHVGAYPSVRSFNSDIAQTIRKNWVPKFEEYGVKAVFEHHDHAYKRTYPLLDNKINPKGIIYLGDGSWGIEKPREPQNRWYLAKAFAKQHVIFVTIDKQKIRYSAIDAEGNLFDEYEQNLHPNKELL